MAARLQTASVGEYSDDREDFESYTERLNAWLVVDGVTDEQKNYVACSWLLLAQPHMLRA